MDRILYNRSHAIIFPTLSRKIFSCCISQCRVLSPIGLRSVYVKPKHTEQVKYDYLLSRKHFHAYRRSGLQSISLSLPRISSFREHVKLHKEFAALFRIFKDTPTTESLLRHIGGQRSFSTSSKTRQQQKNEDDKSSSKDPNPDEEDKMPTLAKFMLAVYLGLFIYAYLRLLQGSDETTTGRYVSWNEFYHDMLAKGEVEQIVISAPTEYARIHLAPGAVVKGRQVSNMDNVYFIKLADIASFEDKIRKAESDMGIKPEDGVSISYDRGDNWASLAVAVILTAFIIYILKNAVNIQMPNPTDMFASERKAKFLRADLLKNDKGQSVTFKDVAGLHEAKVEIMEFVDFLYRPQKYRELGGRIPKGALLLGPPGCGKTLLAKAVASEAKVPFLAMAGSEFVEMFGGLGAARVRDLFKEAGKKAPCIIYIDEIDAIGRKRSGNNMGGGEGGSEEEQTLNQILVEMDGMSSKEGVIIIGSTNRAEVLDKALLRPGRFDRHIQIELPTLAERKEMFEMYLKRLRLAEQATAYSETLAQLSPGMTGADIANICNEAALHAARDKNKVVDHSDFEYAVERVLAGAAKKSRVLSPKEKKVVAYHEAGHALVGWILANTDALLRVSIVPRTSHALGFAQYMPQDKYLYSKEEIFERMCLAMGGRVAESLTFNSVTTGAQDDLRKVTKMAFDQIRVMGMNDVIGHISFPVGERSEFAGKPYSKALQRLMDQEAQKLVTKAYQATEKLLIENKEKLRVIAEALLEKETLTYKDMEQLIGPPTYGKKVIPTLTGQVPSSLA